MLRADIAEALKSELNALAQYQLEKLISRSSWGEITFEEAEQEIKLIFDTAKTLLKLPLMHLPEQTAENIRQCIHPIASLLKQIDNFTLEGSPFYGRDHICDQLKKTTRNFLEATFSIIPSLAYWGGDLQQRTADIERLFGDIQNRSQENEEYIEKKKEELEGIIDATRKAAAEAGISAFAAQFEKEAETLEDSATAWLRTAGVLGLLTLAAAVVFFVWPSASAAAGPWETLRVLGSKATIVAVLFTAAVWCGRIYRATAHRCAINKHRSLSLQTFREFVEGTESPRVKDAILLATTKAIFGNAPTGLVEQSDSADSAIHVELGERFARKAVRNSSKETG